MVKATISVDWFECFFTGRLIEFDFALDEYKYDNGTIRFVKVEGHTGPFNHKYEIQVDGYPFADCWVDSRKAPIIPKEWIRFKVKNNPLYEVGWVKRVERIQAACKWKMNNVTRLDIALDGKGFMDMGQLNKEGHTRKLGKAKMNATWDAAGKVTHWRVGKSVSDKHVTCYYKEKELNKSNKYYIKKVWENSELEGIGEEKGIERMELRLKGEELKKYDDFDWRNLDNFEFLASLMKSVFVRFIAFVPEGEEEDKNISRRKHIEFVDWDSLGAVMLDKNESIAGSPVWAAKITIKRMIWAHQATNQDYFMTIAHDFVKSHAIEDWFIKGLDDWLNKETDIKKKFISSLTQYTPNEQLLLYKTPEQNTGVMFTQGF